MQFRATGGGREGEHVLVYPLKGAPTRLSRSGRRIPLKGSLTWCMDSGRCSALRTPGIIQVDRHFTEGLSLTNLVHNLVKSRRQDAKEHRKGKKPVTKNTADNVNHYKEKKTCTKTQDKGTLRYFVLLHTTYKERQTGNDGATLFQQQQTAKGTNRHTPPSPTDIRIEKNAHAGTPPPLQLARHCRESLQNK